MRVYFDVRFEVSSILLKIKVKGKFILVLLTEHHAMKAYWRSGGITPRIL